MELQKGNSMYKIDQRMTLVQLEERLRNVPLLLSPNIKPYMEADIYKKTVHVNELKPTQTYVLKRILEQQEKLETYLNDENLSMFDLDGALKISCMGKSFWLLPPICEVENDEMIICDGMHRLYTAPHGVCKVIVIKGATHPYYADPLDSWSKCNTYYEPPEQKKVYRDKENYKSLFRNLNDQFEGIQEKR